MKENSASGRQDCAMAQIALNRPRSPVAKVLWLALMVFGCVAIIAMIVLAGR